MSPVESPNNSLTWDDLDLNYTSPFSPSPSSHNRSTSLYPLPLVTQSTSFYPLPPLTQSLMSTTVPPDYDYSFLEQPMQTNTIILGTFLFVVVGLTFTPNLLVLLSFIAEKKLRTTFSALIANLALSDLLLSILSMDFYTIAIVMYVYWPLGKIMCGIWIVVDKTLVFSSCYTLAAIAADRMWSIKWSISYRQYNGMKKAACFVIAIW